MFVNDNLYSQHVIDRQRFGEKAVWRLAIGTTEDSEEREEALNFGFDSRLKANSKTLMDYMDEMDKMDIYRQQPIGQKKA